MKKGNNLDNIHWWYDNYRHDAEWISRLQENIVTKFEIKTLGGSKYFLEIKVIRSIKGIFLSQRKYVLYLL